MVFFLFEGKSLKDTVCPFLSIFLSKSDGKVDVKGDSTFYDTH